MTSFKKLRDHIWFRQTLNTVLVAFSVGILMSLTTILLDLQAERKGAHENAQQIVSILQRPATQAAFNIDSNLANTVVQSLLEYRIIYQARIIDDLGQQLASAGHSKTSDLFDALSENLFGKKLVIRRALEHQGSGQVVGELEITIDTHLVAQQFFQRSAWVIVGGLIRNILLAAALLFIFHKTLSKPVLALISQVAALDPSKPQPSLHVPVSHESTELGKLSDQLNHLLSVLNDSQTAQKKTESELRTHKATLEKTVAERTAELQQANSELEKLATTDSLTSVWNRRAFNQQAGKELERSKRHSRDTTVVMMDIDLFKSVNDTYGHATGDQILKRFAAEVGAHIRFGDIFGRVGGEEFAIMLHDVDKVAAMALAERIRVSVQTMDTLYEENGQKDKLPVITVSMGLVSTGQLQSYNLENLMQHADQALYEAKKAGRNRVKAAIIDPEPAQLKLSSGAI